MDIEFADRPHSSIEVSKALAAKALGISLDPLLVLVKAGYLPDLDISRIANIRSSPVIYSSSGNPVLRSPRSDLVGLSQRSSEEQFAYWATGLTGTSVERVIEADLIPVTLSRYVIAVLSIRGYTIDAEGRIDFIGEVVARAATLGDSEDAFALSQPGTEQSDTALSLLGCLVLGDSGFRYGYLPAEGPIAE